MTITTTATCDGPDCEVCEVVTVGPTMRDTYPDTWVVIRVERARLGLGQTKTVAFHSTDCLARWAMIKTS
jgi:hypothetical protein